MRNSKVCPSLRAVIRITSILLLVVPCFGSFDAPPSLKGSGYGIGDTAFDFAGIDPSGAQMSLYDLYGQFVVVDYCAEWCLPCRLETQDGLLIQPINDVNDQGVHVRFVQVLLQDSLARPATQTTVQRWINRFHLDYPVWSIPAAEYSSVFDQFVNYGLASGASEGAFPTHVLLGPDLKIIGVMQGTTGDPIISNLILASFQTTPSYMVFNLVSQIEDYRLSQPTTLRLEGDLKAAISILTHQNDIVTTLEDKTSGACHSLVAFRNALTRSSDELSPAQAAQLTTGVGQVQSALSCAAQSN